jgi:maltose O-acetyltransferase
MLDNVIKYARGHHSSFLSRIITTGYNILLYFTAIAGYIPFYIFRKLIYTKLCRVKISNDSIIYWRCRFFTPWGIKIGHHCVIGADAILDGRSNIYIGNNVNISSEVRIYTREHDIESPTFGTKGGAVIINDWVYIGTRVIILPNVTIGEGSVVASGSVVTRNVEPWTLVGGVPARFIKNRPKVKYTLNTTDVSFH